MRSPCSVFGAQLDTGSSTVRWLLTSPLFPFFFSLTPISGLLSSLSPLRSIPLHSHRSPPLLSCLLSSLTSLLSLFKVVTHVVVQSDTILLSLLQVCWQCTRPLPLFFHIFHLSLLSFSFLISSVLSSPLHRLILREPCQLSQRHSVYCANLRLSSAVLVSCWLCRWWRNRWYVTALVLLSSLVFSHPLLSSLFSPPLLSSLFALFLLLLLFFWLVLSLLLDIDFAT